MYFPPIINCETRYCTLISQYTDTGCTMKDYRSCEICSQFELCEDFYLSGVGLCHIYTCKDIVPIYRVATQVLACKSILKTSTRSVKPFYSKVKNLLFYFTATSGVFFLSTLGFAVLFCLLRTRATPEAPPVAPPPEMGVAAPENIEMGVVNLAVHNGFENVELGAF